MLCNLLKTDLGSKIIIIIKMDLWILNKSVMTVNEFFWPIIRISYGICKESNEILDAY
jgi:hypothetical protein